MKSEYSTKLLKKKHLWGQNEYVRSREVNIQITEGWEFMYKW
jgi:hypothetical protein